MPGPRDGIRRNVELKALDPEPARSLALCRELGARDEGKLWQRDTYFAIERGRLKLREQRPGDDQLVFYERRNEAAQRESSYWLAPVSDAGELRDLLAAAHGQVAVVEKQRRLLLWDCVRIHLDSVVGLGSFLELEAVAADPSDLEREESLVAELRRRLELTDDRLVPEGYLDLITRR